jgi:hypothetical protein
MERFIKAPYNLAQGDLIAAIVSGQNAVGWSDYSLVNTEGVRVQKKPNSVPKPL